MADTLPQGTTVTYTDGYGTNLKPSVDENIGLFSPQDTPFLRSIGTGKAKQTTEEWLEDELEDAGENAALEGADPDITEAEASGRSGNLTQIFRKTFSVSGTLEATDKYGRSSEVARVSGLKTKALARDMEWNFLNGIRQAGSKTTPRKMDGAFAFVDQSTDSYYDFGGTPAATNHLTEDILVSTMQGMWEVGGTPTTVLAPAAQKKKISSFNQNNRITYKEEANAKRVIAVVDVYQCDFGTVEIIPERFVQPTDDGGTLYDKVLIYDKRIFVRMTLRPIKRTQLAKTGDSEKYMLIGEHTLKCRTKKGVGSIVNLTREPLQ